MQMQLLFAVLYSLFALRFTLCALRYCLPQTVKSQITTQNSQITNLILEPWDFTASLLANWKSLKISNFQFPVLITL